MKQESGNAQQIPQPMHGLSRRESRTYRVRACYRTPSTLGTYLICLSIFCPLIYLRIIANFTACPLNGERPENAQ
eukprot:gene9891-10939_t